MPKYLNHQTSSKERVNPMPFITPGLLYPTERSVVIVRDAGVSSSAQDHYGSEISLSVLEDPYWVKADPKGRNAHDKEQLILKPNEEAGEATVFFLTNSESSYGGFSESSLKVTDCTNHNPEDVWIPSSERPTLELPVKENTVFLGGLFSDTGAEIADITIGMGELDAKANSPFVLELNPDNDETRIHFYSSDTGRWKDLQLFKKEEGPDTGTRRIPDTVLNRIKVLVSTNNGHTNSVTQGFLNGESPEKVLYDDKKAISSTVAVGEREKFFEPGHFFSPQYAVEHTFVPKPEDCPEILYLVGPARGGTTAFGMLMAGVDGVDRSYFQPHKDLLRHGRPLVLHPEDERVVMKETFGPLHDEELFDPVAMLLAAGVPKEKISVIVTLRDPMACFASLTKFVEKMDPEYFARMQEHTLELYEAYRKAGIKVTPFSYDLFGHPDGEQAVLGNLMATAGFDAKGKIPLSFNVEAIKRNMVWGEAEAPSYFAEIVTPTFGRGNFRYTNNEVALPEETRRYLEAHCLKGYQAFKDHSAKVLGLDN